MTARSRMTLRAHVQRSTSPGEDDFGNPLPAEWAEHIASLPIWVHGSTEKEAVTEETTAVVADLKALVPLGTDITEQDRLGGTIDGTTHDAVVDRQGNTVYPGVLGIEAILWQRSHLQLTLSRVSG